MAYRPRRPIPVPSWYLSLSAAFAFIFTVALGYTTATTYNAFRRLTTDELTLLKALGSIVHLDEVLTMSARMAAATGDLRWADRYREAEPRLNAAIQLAQELAPGTDELRSVLKTDEANSRLVAMELRCLDLVSAGDPQRAMECVFSEEYESLKSGYMSGAVESLRACEARINREVSLQRRATLVNGALALLSALAGFMFLIAHSRSADRRRLLEHEMHVILRRNTVGGLAATLAHELNQPLAAIVNYCGAATTAIEASSPPRQDLANLIDNVERQAQRAGQIIQHVRSFISDDAAAFSQTSLADVMRDSLALARLEARHAGVTLRAIARDSHMVHGDAIQLQQVIVNLLINAIAACHDARDDGQIQLELRSENGEAILEVRDNGPGVPKDAERHLFSGFFTTKSDGQGLGLAISREIVENHGGRLTYHREGSWSVFQIRLPALTTP